MMMLYCNWSTKQKFKDKTRDKISPDFNRLNDIEAACEFFFVEHTSLLGDREPKVSE
jgi:hypothetical protein